MGKLGTAVGTPDGTVVGTALGTAVGADDGADDGADEGRELGADVGAADGTLVGAPLGKPVGAGVWALARRGASANGSNPTSGERVRARTESSMSAKGSRAATALRVIADRLRRRCSRTT